MKSNNTVYCAEDKDDAEEQLLSIKFKKTKKKQSKYTSRKKVKLKFI
jgi:hypothetical protein